MVYTIENTLGIIGYILRRPDELFTVGTTVVDLITIAFNEKGKVYRYSYSQDEWECYQYRSMQITS